MQSHKQAFVTCAHIFCRFV